MKETEEYQIPFPEETEFAKVPTHLKIMLARIEKIINDELLKKAQVSETANKLSLDIDESNYVMTLKLLDKNDNELDSKSIDFPIEQMVIDADYDENNKSIELVLKNGNKVSFSVADLVAGLVSETAFTTAIENLEGRLQAKFNVINTKLDTIDEGAQVNSIESIRINGAIQAIGPDKSVNIEIQNGGTVGIQSARQVITSGTVIVNEFEITLPINYTVGDNSLALYWNGSKLIKATDTEDGHYKEVGTSGSISNKIKMNRTESDGNYKLISDVILEEIVTGVSEATATEEGGVV